MLPCFTSKKHVWASASLALASLSSTWLRHASPKQVAGGLRGPWKKGRQQADGSNIPSCRGVKGMSSVVGPMAGPRISHGWDHRFFHVYTPMEAWFHMSWDPLGSLSLRCEWPSPFFSYPVWAPPSGWQLAEEKLRSQTRCQILKRCIGALSLSNDLVPACLEST